MIDQSGYRYGVGIILVNDNRQVFFAKRIGMPAWQFPQGGIKENETPEETMFRELQEEIGLSAQDVKVLACTKRWLRYRLPPRFQRSGEETRCIGQKQKWFLLSLLVEDACIRVDAATPPEFDEWKWVDYWQPLKEVIFFKLRVYEKILREFESVITNRQ